MQTTPLQGGSLEQYQIYWVYSTKYMGGFGGELPQGESRGEMCYDYELMSFRFLEAETAKICIDFSNCGPCYNVSMWG